VRASRIIRHTAALALLTLLASGAAAQVPENTLGFDLFDTARGALERENIGTSLMLVFLVTVISLAPALLMMTTCFTRIIVVMGFLRQALATQQTPPNQVLIGLSLILSFFIMLPTYQDVNDNALQPYIAGELTQQEAFNEALLPIRAFMFKQTRPENLKLFLDIGNYERPESPEDISTWVLMPAFTLSELETAFMIGFVLYIPFLIIDMVVASTLMAMGMMMLPPIFVSLPFKIIMFVLADGWRLLIGSLVQSFQT
jgi:flagellar biosynthetic protein FliP